MLHACRVAMDGVPGSFKAWHNPAQRWNGWGMPFLPRAEAERLMGALNATAGNMEPDAYYNPAQDAFCFPNQETYEVAVSDGIEYRAGYVDDAVEDMGHDGIMGDIALRQSEEKREVFSLVCQFLDELDEEEEVSE